MRAHSNNNADFLLKYDLVIITIGYEMCEKEVCKSHETLPLSQANSLARWIYTSELGEDIKPYVYLDARIINIVCDVILRINLANLPDLPRSRIVEIKQYVINRP